MGLISLMLQEEQRRELQHSSSSGCPGQHPQGLSDDNGHALDQSQKGLTIFIIALVAICWLTSVIVLIFAKPCRDTWGEEVGAIADPYDDYDYYESNADTETSSSVSKEDTMEHVDLEEGHHQQHHQY